ncbi:hypothetical protein PSP31120_02582 [Pandoraea sputorum]|nr:hypothetical protein PSP31120_02582 [Pandoraea sputorum]
MSAANYIGLPLCRPSPYSDEWSETYLFRVARANGIYRPRMSDIERLRPTLGSTASSRSDGYPVWSPSTLPRWSVVTRVNPIRYCPQCMVECRYIRARWRLTRLDVCTLHGVRLKDDLAEPVMTKGYRQPEKHFITEVTDEQLWEGALCPMPCEMRHARRLWSGFERLLNSGNNAEAFDELVCILFLEAMLDAIATTYEEPGLEAFQAPRSAQIAELVDRFQFPVEPSLDGIERFLMHIERPSHRIAVLMRLRRMLLDEPMRPTCLSTLPIAELRQSFLMERCTVPRPRKQSVVSPARDVPEGYISFDAAVVLIGCPSEMLRHLIHHDVIQDSRTVLHGIRRHTYLPERAVKECRRWYASLVTPRQVARELCVDYRAYAALRSMDILRPIVVENSQYFRKTDLVGVCRKLEDISHLHPGDTVRTYSLFGDWMAWRGGTKALSLKIVRDVFNGNIPVYRKLDCPGLSAYFVDETAVRRLRELRRVEGGRTRKRHVTHGQLSLLPQ